MTNEQSIEADKPTETVGYYTTPEWTWRDKLRAKLFPRGFCEMPEAPKICTPIPSGNEAFAVAEGGPILSGSSPGYSTGPAMPRFHVCDCVIVQTRFVLGWKDRLRVFLTGRCEVETKVITENVVGDCVSNAEWWASPWKWLSSDDR